MTKPLATTQISALSAAQTPRRVSILVNVCVWFFLLIPIFVLLSPWQQNIVGYGRVSAFAPIERQQTIDAPVGGRISKWYVQENSLVRTGDRLIEITDIDPEQLPRLQQQRDASVAKVTAKEDELRAYKVQIDNLIATRDLQVATAQHRLDVARQRARAAEEAIASAAATLTTATAQRTRYQRLLKDGLVSRRDYEVAERDEEIAKRSLNSAQASLKGAVAEQRAAQADIDRIRADAQARIDSSTATANKTRSELEESRASLAKMEVDLARQQAQVVKAPRDGRVLRLLANPQGDIVKQGDSLLILVPNVETRAVELLVDGNDAPLITPGRHVRLMFEGWPAVQFVGYPEVAVGTFGGVVAFVDATDDGKGKFRVLIVPDEKDRPWPSEHFLRQGVRTRGWILLNQVSLAYEIWRQLNGFPPLLTPETPFTDLARKRLGK